MFELSNEQRRCFALLPVEENWTQLELKPSPYDHHTTLAYLDGRTLRKFIETGSNLYREYEICEQLSEDLQYLLPKTAKGKSVPLSAATLKNRTGLGMCLTYVRHNNGYTYYHVFSHTSEKHYYSNAYEATRTYAKDVFPQGVAQWCSETAEADLLDIARFSQEPRQRVKFREGDVFRFKINRRLYGYGRVLLDYARMRKTKEPFWDVLMGKPTVCSVYHIATERADVTVEELQALDSLPSCHMMDNHLFYGDFQIIGNIPIGEREDYPILYGSSIDARYRGVLLQCGKLYRKIDGGQALTNDFMNNGIGFTPDFSLSVLLEYIVQKSNAPYWAQNTWRVRGDLRNPKFRPELARIADQFGLDPAQLLK